MRLTYLTLFLSIFAASLAGAPPARAVTQRATHWLVLLTEKPVVEQYPGRIEKTRAAAAGYRQHLQQAQAALRPQIEGMHARVTGSVQHLLNGILVAATPAQAAALRKLPGVKAVTPLRRYRKLDQLNMSNVSQAWAAAAVGGETNAGAGIKIGIIDSGIDQTHPAFQDSTLVAPAGFPKYDNAADQAFTTNKIIVARSYVSYLVDQDVCSTCTTASASRPDDVTARDLDGHGTGVASVAAGMPVSYNGTVITGVAPKAFLGNYKVFGSDEVNAGASFEGPILALEDAVTDGMDVVNMSFGSPVSGGPLDEDSTYCPSSGLPNSPITIPTDACDPLAYEVENAMDQALVTVVVAAGNQGVNGYEFNYGCGAPPCDNYSTPTFSTVSSPAYAPSAIAVGAIENDVTYVQQVEISASGAPTDVQAIVALESYDGPAPSVPLSAPLIDVTQAGDSDGLLCNALAATALSGVFVLVQQGTCADATKVANAQSAGAAGVIEIADVSGSALYAPYGLGGTTIPTFIIDQSDGASLKSYIDSNPGATATLDPRPYQVTASSQGYAPFSVAIFSSRGPVTENGALKPDLSAAGTNFLMPTESYDPYGELFNFSRYGTADGTSFATPMVSGSAALVKQTNPNLTPAQIKSALVNTAALSNLTTSDNSAQASISEVGAGLLQTQNAVISTVQVAPSSISFGSVGVSLVTSVPLKLYNSGASPVSLAFTVTQSSAYAATSAQVAVAPASVTISAGGQASVSVGLSGGQPPPGRYEGVVTASGGPVPLNIPYMYLVPYTAVEELVPYDVIPLNGVQPAQGFNAFDGVVGAYIPWYSPCESGGNQCVTDYGSIAVLVIDQYGAPVPDVPVEWGVTEGNGIIDVNNSDVETNSDGVAGAAAYLGTAAGPQEFAVLVDGISYPLPFDGYARVAPAINAGGIVDGASFKLTSVAPGSWISVFGTNMTDTTQGASGVDVAFSNCTSCNVTSQALPMGIDGAAFSFDTSSQSLPGRLNYVSPTQLNLQVPWEVAGQSSVLVKSIVNYTYSSVYTLPVTQYSPGFFVTDTGNDVAALDLSYNLVDSSNPIARGSYVQLFLNGLGAVTNQPGDGLGAPGPPNLAQTTATPTITIGGQAVTNVQFSGLAPGFVSLYQVNVQVPEGISAGQQAISCTIGGVTSTTAELWVK